MRRDTKEQLEFIAMMGGLGIIIIVLVMCMDQGLKNKRRSCLADGGTWIAGATYESSACIESGKSIPYGYKENEDVR